VRYFYINTFIYVYKFLIIIIIIVIFDYVTFYLL